MDSGIPKITKPLLYQLSYASFNDEIISDFKMGVKDKVFVTFSEISKLLNVSFNPYLSARVSISS